MSLEDLGNLGEFLAAIGVIVSLIYLAVQIRQNTRSIQASSLHDALSGAAEFARYLANDKDTTRLFRMGLPGVENLTDPDDRLRFMMLLTTLARRHEDLFLQHQKGTIDTELWEPWNSAIDGFLGWPGFRTFWDLRRVSFAPGFRDLMDAQIAAHSGESTQLPEWMGPTA